MQPFFSIVIPTYNRANFITTTLQSLMLSSFNDFEIIVVDDGSVDDTEEKVSSLVKVDNRVKYYKKENGERGAARNFGACLAKGEYILFFDSDDLAYPNHLEVAYQIIEKIKGQCEVFHTAYDVQKDGVRLPSSKRIKAGKVNSVLIKDNILSCNNVFIRKDIALKHPFPEDRRMAIAEDWALWLILASRYPIIHHDVVTSTIVYHDNRSVFDFNPEKIVTRDLLLIDFLWSDAPFKEFYKKHLNLFKAERYTFLSLILAINKQKKESLLYLIKALKTSFKILLTRRFYGALKSNII